MGVAKVGEPSASRIRRLWARHVKYPIRLRADRHTDVYHILDHSYADLTHRIRQSAGVVCTVHDILPLLDPGGLSEAQVKRFRSRVACLAKADRILCDSDFTRKSVTEQLGIPVKRMETVLLGVDDGFFDADSERWHGKPLPVDRKALLVVGSSINRKNLVSIPSVIGALGHRRREYAVVKVGQILPPATKEELADLLGEGGVVELGYVPEKSLPHVYAASFALLFPSLLEGFGFPLLEAMAAGCPVVSSNRSSLPEVGGDAACWYDPDEPKEAAAALWRLATEENFRTEMIAKGKIRAREMSWERHAARVYEIYEEVAKEKGGIR